MAAPVAEDEPQRADPAGVAAGVAAARQRFDYLPVALFASVMGLSGLSVAWRLATHLYGVPMGISHAIAIVAVAAFLLLTIAYLAKAILAFDAVVAEFRHPVAGNLFSTVIISSLLLPIVLAPHAPFPARILWTVGAAAMFGFAWLIINRWMSDRQQIAHATPAWIVPVVGLLDVPLAAPSLSPAPPADLLIGCLAIGLFFAVPLFTMIFSRLLFGRPLPPALQPAVLILVAPFSVGFSAYVAITGQVDGFATGLYALTIFLLAVLLGRLRQLAQCCPFRVAWWAVSFPLAASASAAIRFAAATPRLVPSAIGLALLALASCVIAGLFVRTLLGIFRGELRTLST
ncbi:SLAC1 anion channel family protein [Sphingomonas endolithica]|uniref:SLAC1 anion channel family protein n=1 Tax=Sphingomonas endolithica TaxID=2972485 RepID=UPI0021B04804|nr:SLAC1 anion channel family protein [Sphingomonas sp. ZFBP2030]